MPEATDLAEKLRVEGEKFAAIFASLTNGQWDTVVYTEGETWTMLNVLSHIVSSERSLLKLFERIRTTGKGSAEDFSIDRYNSVQQQKTKDISAQELLEQYKEARSNSVIWVSSLKEEELEIQGRHPFLGMTTIRDMIKMLYIHNQNHYRDMKKAIK